METHLISSAFVPITIAIFECFLNFIFSRCIDLNDENSFAYSSTSQNLEMKEYLQIDNQIRCWDQYHLSWCYQIATPSLIFWGLIKKSIPTYFIFISKDLESLHLLFISCIKIEINLMMRTLNPNMVFYMKAINLINIIGFYSNFLICFH